MHGFKSRRSSKTMNGGRKQRRGQHTLTCQKIYKKSRLWDCHIIVEGLPISLQKFSLIDITNFRRGRVCGNANCANCTAADCGSCRRCLKPSAKNKCIRRFSSIFIFMISCISVLQKLCHVLSPLTQCSFVEYKNWALSFFYMHSHNFMHNKELCVVSGYWGL